MTDPVKESIPNITHIPDGTLIVYTLSAGENMDTVEMGDS